MYVNRIYALHSSPLLIPLLEVTALKFLFICSRNILRGLSVSGSVLVAGDLRVSKKV